MSANRRAAWLALLHTGSSVSMTTRKDHGCRDELVLSLDICSYCIMHVYRLTYAHKIHMQVSNGPWPFSQSLRAAYQGSTAKRSGRREERGTIGGSMASYWLSLSLRQQAVQSREGTDLSSLLHTAVRTAFSCPPPSICIIKMIIKSRAN